MSAGDAMLAEIMHDWRTAEQRWRECGREDEAQICARIADAIDAGDAWRVRVAMLQGRGLSFEEAAAQATEEERRAHAGRV